MKKTRITLFFLLLGTLFLTGACKSPGKTKEDASLKVRDIFAGVSNVFILREDGTLWSAGYNRSGQLGLGEPKSPVLEQNTSEDDVSWGIVQTGEGDNFLGVKYVAAGEYHTVILKDDGTLWAAGESPFGELGLGSNGPSRLSTFTPLNDSGGTAITGVQSVCAGNNSTFFIKNDGTLWAAGYNYYGELGLGDRESRPAFTQVPVQDVKAAAAGARHTVILKNDGTVWTAGYNFNGQLAQSADMDSYGFDQVKDLSQAAAVAAGNYHTVILKSDGTVWAAGQNYYGQLGTSGGRDSRRMVQVKDDAGQPMADAAEIAARGDMTMILKKDGTLFWAGTYAEPLYDNSFEPPPDNASPEPTFVQLKPEDGASLGKIKKIVLGYRNIYVITADGHLWAAGSSQYGQISADQDSDASLALKQIYP